MKRVSERDNLQGISKGDENAQKAVDLGRMNRFLHPGNDRLLHVALRGQLSLREALLFPYGDEGSDQVFLEFYQTFFLFGYIQIFFEIVPGCHCLLFLFSEFMEFKVKHTSPPIIANML